MISAVILAPSVDSVPKKLRDSLSFSDEIITVPVNGDFAEARNEGMQKAKNEWIFSIDSDEEVNDELKNEIQTLATDPGLSDLGSSRRDGLTTDAYYIPRRDFFWGRELKYGEPQSARTGGIIRLVKKGSGKWVGAVHERFETKGETAKLSGFINHYPHQTIAEFLSSINEYSTIRASELFKQGIRTNLFQIILYPFGKFWYTYLLKLGFLDGPAGFVYSFMMSFHSFLVRSKLYLRTLKVQNRPL